jgi:sulfur carrier protein ThiS
MAWVRVRIPRSYLVYHPGLHAEEPVELRDGETVRDLVRRLGLNELEFGIVLVKGERELMSYRPRDGEQIELLPIIQGGAPLAGPWRGERCVYRVTGPASRVRRI